MAGVLRLCSGDLGAVRCCVPLLAATKVKVEFGAMDVWRHDGGVIPDGLSWLWCRFYHAVRMQLGFVMLPAKAVTGVAGGMTAASLTSLSLLGASFMKLQLCCKGSLGENPVL